MSYANMIKTNTVYIFSRSNFNNKGEVDRRYHITYQLKTNLDGELT